MSFARGARARRRVRASHRAARADFSWFATTGFVLDTAEATSTLLRLFLLVFFAGETGVLFLHLRGVVDTFAFIIGGCSCSRS